MESPPARSGESESPGLPYSRPELSPVGTRRRLRALAARSWTPAAIGKESGIPAVVIGRELDGQDVIGPEMAGRVAAIYDRLWDRRPPAATTAEREAAAQIMARADRSGWAPPAAWDDDLIDLPCALPAAGWRPGSGRHRRAADIVEDAEFVRRHDGLQDATLREVAMRLGIRRERLEKAYIRARQYAARSAGRPTQGREAEAEAG